MARKKKVKCLHCGYEMKSELDFPRCPGCKEIFPASGRHKEKEKTK